MVPADDLKMGQLRMLEVDNPLVIPKGQEVRLILTSDDVIHNFAVPALGIKRDVIPGRLNEISIISDREGMVYGQCSELCGSGHAARPIQILTMCPKEFGEMFLESDDAVKRPISIEPVKEEPKLNFFQNLVNKTKNLIGLGKSDAPTKVPVTKSEVIETSTPLKNESAPSKSSF